MKIQINALLKSMANTWPSGIVAREDFEKFSGGLYTPKYMANLDALGKGPKDRIRINGRKIAYTVSSVIEWLAARSTMLD